MCTREHRTVLSSLSVGVLYLSRAVATYELTYAWLFENRPSVISWWCSCWAHPGIGTLSPLPTVALRTDEASYLAPSARTDDHLIEYFLRQNGQHHTLL